MWAQNYIPIGNSLALSSVVAALPLAVILFMLGVLRKPAWISGLCGCATALLVALFGYGMPAGLAISATIYGAAYGLMPIGWIVFTAVLLYRLLVETGKFEVIKSSIAGLTSDRNVQALLVAFAFGAFIEGAAGFGTPVAVAAAMLTGMGFSPFYAAGICLLANTAPVAFGSIGIPVVTLQSVTGLPMDVLSGNVGRICAPLSLFIPAYLVLVMGGLPALRSVLPAVVLCGVTFASTQFLVSNFMGPYLTDILGALFAMLGLVLLLLVWKPKGAQTAAKHSHSTGAVISAWAPYGFLVLFVVLWGTTDVKAWLDKVGTWRFGWPGLDGNVARVPPVVTKEGSYAAVYTLNLLSASGTSCLFAAIASALFAGVAPGKFMGWVGQTFKQLALPLVTIASVLGLAYLMNYSGATATLGLAAAGTGVLFPFFGSLLGWLGVFLTGSDTSANALFGNLQVLTAQRLGLNPGLMAAANSAAGVMGKMISLQSLAVAAAATGMPPSDEAKLFRFTLGHSVALSMVLALIVCFYAYVMPGWVR